MHLVFGLFNSPASTAPNRPEAPGIHWVLGTPINAPAADGQAEALFGCGCFWGAEKGFWRLPGVITTAVGYAGGQRPDPSYQQVCSGRSGHAEVVRVVWDRSVAGFSDLLKLFWECHDPTQGMAQGNDTGTQYRSAIYVSSPELLKVANASRDRYQQLLNANGFGAITSEIAEGLPFYFAEAYHQQYLAKNPNGYCGLGGTGVEQRRAVHRARRQARTAHRKAEGPEPESD